MALPIHTRWRLALLAGIAGGAGEIIWVAVYSLWQGTDGWQVAHGVTAALAPMLATSSVAVPVGIAIHLLLSVLLAAALLPLFAWLRRRYHGVGMTLLVALAALVVVWVTNFFIILPTVAPAFLPLLPNPVTLMSKLLFGFAMALVLVRAPRPVAVAGDTATSEKQRGDDRVILAEGVS